MTNDLAENGQAELFEVGKHLVTYGGDDELVEKVRFYLKNEAERRKIGSAGEREVCAKHTYRHRMEQVLETASECVRVGIRLPTLVKEPILGEDPYYFEHSRPEILDLVPQAASVVLDVGCGAGHVGRALKKRQKCTVYGAEINRDAAERAEPHLDRVWHGDIQSMELDLAEESLDVIICGDVLEHLRDPRQVLRGLRKYLRPDGQLIASIPNAGHHTVIRGLLAGNWTYEPAGILDETHLRFFTVREIEKLFFRAGFRVDKLKAIPGPGDEPDLASRPGPIRLGEFAIDNLPRSTIESLSAYQYLVLASPDSRAAAEKLTSIVMLTSNQLEYTRMCLASLRACTDEPYEVIVVDNGSTDGTVDYLRRLEGVRLISNAENRGFPAAVNQGVRASRGDYVVLINNDCIVTTGWLTRLQSAANSGPEIGLVGPYSNCVSGQQQIPVDYQILSELDGFAWEWAKTHAGQRLLTERLVAFCLLITRPVIDRIGVLDERFGLGNFEDDDYCRRALEAGFKAVIAEDAFVHHFGSITYRSMGSGYASLMDHNRRLFLEKWNEKSTTELPAIEAKTPSPRFELEASSEPGLRIRLARPRVSLCMIVRDSAATLAACLKSIRPWVDEMIVVDTGSRDATPEIARSYGAEVCYFPWCDDFSAARNESLSHATGNWIFWMDSDDTIDAENGRKLRELVDGQHAAGGDRLCGPGSLPARERKP